MIFTVFMEWDGNMFNLKLKYIQNDDNLIEKNYGKT